MAPLIKKKIFISYRVKDTQAATGRLVDALKQHFDEDQIFLDIDKIEPGLDFTEVISKYLDSSDIMLAIIGPDWMGYNSEKGTYRINELNDWVRTEIATALKRNIRVVPVLLDGANMPDDAILPDELKPLLRRQSYEISNKRWKYDSEELIQYLQKALGQTPKPNPRPGNIHPNPPKSNSKYILIGLVVLILLVLLKFTPSGKNDNNLPPAKNDSVVVNPVSPPAVEPGNPVQPVSAETKNIAGNWYDPNGKGTYIFSQNAEQVSLKVYALSGQQTGEGIGSINGGNVTVHLTLSLNNVMIPCDLQLIIAQDGYSMSGNIKIEENGAAYSEKIFIERQ
ncbi:MAG: toll/interleukin-1 receptor domain-containing protein [Chitinophagaceae bacterium]|jgi:hypothetical protein